MQRDRREFLAAVGRGTIAASIGTALAADLGLSRARAADKDEALTFGPLEPLVCLMQETAPGKLLPALVEKMRAGTELQTLVAAAALANARTFGGEDYVGFHTMMALAPAWHMARELPTDQAALPVLKVLYRNTNRIQEFGGRPKEVLHANLPAVHVREPQEQLRETVRAKKADEAEGVLAVAARGGAQKALDAVLCAVEDNTEVHRVVLPYRAWDLLPVIGKEHALTLLRQSVRYCVKSEANNWNRSTAGVRTMLPALLEKHKLLEPKTQTATRKADDAWVAEMSETIFKARAEDAAAAAAQALADGFDPGALGEAICLAANQLILRDNGRPKGQTASNKPEGSVHGDSIGVHACDSANAWRNLARASTGRNSSACLILGAFQVAFDRVERGGDFLAWEAYPRAEARDKVKDVKRDDLLKEAEGAIKENNQARAAALVHRCGELGVPERPVFELLLRYAVSQDGALHAEKYYRTVSEEFAAARPAFKWRQLVALARVTASEHGYAAPGYKEAYELLKGS
jgi:hypothetical protein